MAMLYIVRCPILVALVVIRSEFCGSLLNQRIACGCMNTIVANGGGIAVAVAQGPVNYNENDDCTEASTAKLFGTVSGNDGSEKIIHGLKVLFH